MHQESKWSLTWCLITLPKAMIEENLFFPRARQPTVLPVEADGTYHNFTGCGNTLNCNPPVVRDLLLNCLRYWVDRVHVDGFRFDLASVLGRDPKGHVLLEPPSSSPLSKMVYSRYEAHCEPWDAAGVYQVANSLTASDG